MNTKISAGETQKDDRTIVTPYAFSVSENLLNTPLASPFRRLCAILIDFTIISLSSIVEGMLLFLIVAYGMYALAMKRHMRPWVRGLLLIIIAPILVALLLRIYTFGHETYQDYKTQSLIADFGLEEGLSTLKVCETEECRRESIVLLEKQIEKKAVDHPTERKREAKRVISDFMEPNAQVEMTKSDLARKLSTTLPDHITIVVNEDESITTSDVPVGDATLSVNPSIAGAMNAEEESNTPSLIGWIKAFLEDLGISFGVAAIYFSVLTTRCNGQTLGKRLLGVRVILLNGDTPNLWQSFGRYGGYGAGFATGLLGFLQVFWDSNRQAIQDKISETLVIRVLKS